MHLRHFSEQTPYFLFKVHADDLFPPLLTAVPSHRSFITWNNCSPLAVRARQWECFPSLALHEALPLPMRALHPVNRVLPLPLSTHAF